MVSDEDLVKACPSCDSTSVYPNQSQKHSTHGDPSGWYCKRCGAGFEEPVERERYQERRPHTGVGRFLERADQELVPDGGRELDSAEGYPGPVGSAPAHALEHLETRRDQLLREAEQLELVDEVDPVQPAYCRGKADGVEEVLSWLEDHGDRIVATHRAVVDPEAVDDTPTGRMLRDVADVVADHINQGADPSETAGALMALTLDVAGDAGVPEEDIVESVSEHLDVDVSTSSSALARLRGWL